MKLLQKVIKMEKVLNDVLLKLRNFICTKNKNLSILAMFFELFSTILCVCKFEFYLKIYILLNQSYS